MNDTRFPIYFLTGVSYARDAESQQLWQSMHDRHMAKLLESLNRRLRQPLAKSAIAREFFANNMFMAALS